MGFGKGVVIQKAVKLTCAEGSETMSRGIYTQRIPRLVLRFDSSIADPDFLRYARITLMKGLPIRTARVVNNGLNADEL